jgi:DNA-binding NtrC family response regulator
MMSLTLDRPVSASTVAARVAEGRDVLVVDDDDTFRELVTSRLEAAGATVYEAESVFEAIECLECRHLDVVICDYSLPAARGADLLAYLRRRGLPVTVVLTSGELRVEAAVEVFPVVDTR